MTRKKHINKFLAPTRSRDNPANLFMFMCFFFPRIKVNGLFSGTPPWWKTAPLKRPINRSMRLGAFGPGILDLVTELCPPQDAA